MLIVKNNTDLKNVLSSFWNQETIGFIPTMGALHEGHLSLIQRAKRQNKRLVVSIFVNPTQFNNPSDFEKYPRVIDKDLQLLEAAGIDVVYLPEPEIMYPQPMLFGFDLKHIDTIMEGKYRPGHFNGVATVVIKLLNLVKPTKAYFGEKDFQQLTLIKILVDQLFIDTEIVGCPTLRENSGLALSSRNMRLSDEGKVIATRIYQSLSLTAGKLIDGIPFKTAEKEGEIFLYENKAIKPEYFEIWDADTLQIPNQSTKNLVIAVACYVEGVRLIDNLVVPVIIS